jgi:hypothetical protein
MKLTKKQLKKIIQEEIQKLTQNTPLEELEMYDRTTGATTAGVAGTPQEKIQSIIKIVDQAKMNKSLNMPDGRAAEKVLDMISLILKGGTSGIK